LETIFWVKILEFFDADPGSGLEGWKKVGSGMEKNPGSGINAVLANVMFFIQTALLLISNLQIYGTGHLYRPLAG
jgi:hypothetical protein